MYEPPGGNIITVVGERFNELTEFEYIKRVFNDKFSFVTFWHHGEATARR